MQVSDTPVEGVKILDPKVFGDERGFFLESWNARGFAALELDLTFVQDNHSRSVRNTLRGLHYQVERPQGKLVRVTRGEVFDVTVDIRKRSPTYGRWFGLRLSEANRRMLWLPPGMAHGFYVLSDTADFQYKCTEYYSPEHERSILWSDPALGIDWPVPVGETPLLSPKDARGVPLAEAQVFL
jgi:dTDP-4-dehydrorhamnose 3,5-epimerase